MGCAQCGLGQASCHLLFLGLHMHAQDSKAAVFSLWVGAENPKQTS